MGLFLRAFLDVIIKERQTSLKELHSVLQVALMLFYFEGNRKVVLCSEIEKHKVWDDSETWKACLQRVINQKFRDAVDQLEKERLEKIEE